MRKVYAPYSQSGENVAQTPLEGYIEIEQKVTPTISTGFVDENGLWTGPISSETSFTIRQTDLEIANGAEIITPSKNADGTWPLDMTGFNDIFIAFKPSNGGNYNIAALMGPDDVSFADLSPVNPAAVLKGNSSFVPSTTDNLFVDSSEALTADVWNIFSIQNRLKNQKLLMFGITNNSGGITNIDSAFMRMI